jgi:hypothetical protein
MVEVAVATPRPRTAVAAPADSVGVVVTCPRVADSEAAVATWVEAVAEVEATRVEVVVTAAVADTVTTKRVAT